MPDFKHSSTSLNVLVIDDEANIRMTISMCLSADGHRAVACGQIEEALELVRARRST